MAQNSIQILVDDSFFHSGGESGSGSIPDTSITEHPSVSLLKPKLLPNLCLQRVTACGNS